MPEELAPLAEDAEQRNPKIEGTVAQGQLMASTAKNIRTLLAGARIRKSGWSPEQGGTYPHDQQEDDHKSAAYQPAKIGDDRAALNRHQIKLQGDELVRCERRIGGVGNQFQERAPAGIAHDSHVAPGSFWLNVDQVRGLGSSDERRIGRVTQPQPDEALFIACVGLFRRSLEIRRAAKWLHPGEEMDEVEHIDRLAIIGLGPWAETGNECLNRLLRKRELFNDRQVLIDLRLSELAPSLGMPSPEGRVQANEHGGKSELKPHLCSVLEFVPLCGSQSCPQAGDSSNRNA